MPCNYYGKIIPGDRASCIAGGGTWVSEPSLMSDPTTGQGLPMTGINPLWEGAGRKDVTVDTSGNIDPIILGSINPGNKVKALTVGAKELSKKIGGTPVPSKPLRPLQRTEKPVQGERIFDTQKSTPSATPVANKTSIFKNPAQWMKEHPYQTAGVALPVGASLFTGGENTSTPTTPTTNTTPTPTPPPPPEKKNLWDRMQTSGYWFDPVKNGSGNWDNRLFRLGEMMSYMGTPLSKRGDSPAKRWTTASAEQNKAEAAAKKAADKELLKRQRDSQDAAKLNESTLLRMFTPESGNFFGKSKQEAAAAGAAQVAAYESARAVLIEANQGRTVTHGDVMKFLADKYGKK